MPTHENSATTDSTNTSRGRPIESVLAPTWDDSSRKPSWLPVRDACIAASSGRTTDDFLGLARENRNAIEMALSRSGALLFRNTAVRGPTVLRDFIEATSTVPMEYQERSSPRTDVGGRIYTSTDYPADQHIFMHNEHSYARTVPLKIYFHCVEAARVGGHTPTADCRRVLTRISAATRLRFERLGWLYVRNFGGGLGLPWREAFRTEDRRTVEKYCEENQIEYEWGLGDRLRTRQRRPATVVHPWTGQDVWFNHVAFFHVTTLPRDVRDGLLMTFPSEDLPNNTYYGDGSAIDHQVLEEIRNAYLAERTQFEWQPGDILMLDNLATAHGRTSFCGARRILVGMSDAWTREVR